MKAINLSALIWMILACSRHFQTAQSLATPTNAKGCAARPAQKKKIAVLGTGGYTGALTFGFLQRACSLYGTGMGQCRCIGATADTSRRLNSYLSKHFCLAMADESYIKLTDLSSVDALVQRLQGWDALVMGTNLGLSRRPVTANTYERTPNDKAWEVYWDPPGNLAAVDPLEETRIKSEMVQNVLQAAKQAGVQHVVALVDDDEKANVLPPLLQDSGVPFTCIHPIGELVDIPNYTYRKGVQGILSVSSDANAEGENGGGPQVSKEDLAALCVQTLQSLDWNKSRHLKVSCQGPVSSNDDDSFVNNPKRPDQEWCVDSYRLQAALAGIE